jgi:uncharacterized membrane protein
MTIEVPGKPAGRSLRVPLMVSLALNVLFIGGIASAFILSHHGHPGRKGGLMAFAHTLPKERRDAIREKLKGGQATLAPLRKAEHEAREAARAILLEDPFDKDKFKAALNKAVDADTEQKRARMALFADTTAELTPAERKQLHDWIERHRPNPPPPPPGDVDDGKPD